MEFKDRLRDLRNRNNLTQEQLGRNFNVIKQTVSSWENGNSRPDIEIASKLADYFNVTADYLLGRSDDIAVQTTNNDYKDCLESVMRSALLELAGISNQVVNDTAFDVVDNTEKASPELIRERFSKVAQIDYVNGQPRTKLKFLDPTVEELYMKITELPIVQQRSLLHSLIDRLPLSDISASFLHRT